MSSRLDRWLDVLGLTWFQPLAAMARGEPAGWQMRRLGRMVGLPLAALLAFHLGWSFVARSVHIGAQNLPGPGDVYAQAWRMWGDYRAERVRAAEHDAQVRKMVVDMNGQMSEAEVRAAMPYAASPTYVDQILTSLLTVFTGFLIAAAVGIPLGILCGLSQAVYEMFNPIIQILKPVSPLAWLPIVWIVVGAAVSSDAGVSKSFLIAAIVVGICAVWPTLLNTANGVANVERDHLNVARVLNLGFLAKVRRIILPAALPAIFTGLRLSLGIGWMVLIAAEMLSQNPGLGKFVWDMYQSSSDQTLATIMVAVITIGGVGFVLDRLMISAQKLVTHGAPSAIR